VLSFLLFIKKYIEHFYNYNKKDLNILEIEKARPFSRIPEILGFLESGLYTNAFLIGKYEFISYSSEKNLCCKILKNTLFSDSQCFKKMDYAGKKFGRA